MIIVEDEYGGQRLDNFLLRELKGVPRSLIYRMVRRGEVRVNDSRARVHARLQPGDRIRIPPLRLPKRPPRRALPTNLPLDVLFEDAYLMVVNKPAGIAVHAGSGISTGLIEHLRQTRPEIRFLELVHRLDRETSGCLVLSKRRSVLRALHENLRQTSKDQHRFKKKYQALVHGRWRVRSQTVDIPLRKNVERSGERLVLPVKDGLYAKSEFTSLQHFDSSTLVSITLITGRTHQARVHAAASGHPIVGDEKYGIKQVNSFYRSIGLRRLFLHANYISFVHPVTLTKIELTSPLPLELEQVIKKLSAAGSGSMMP